MEPQVARLDSSAALANPVVEAIASRLAAQRGIDQLAAAFVDAWAEIDNVTKNSNNPHLGNDYADLAAVMGVIKPVFIKHKLALTQLPGRLNEKGDRIEVSLMLWHRSGQHLNATMELPCGAPPKKGSSEPQPPTAQSAGSAITYARRYQAMALVGMAPIDDDGNQAAGRTGAEVDTMPNYQATMSSVAMAVMKNDRDALEACKADVEKLGDTTAVKAFLDGRETIKKATKTKKKD